MGALIGETRTAPAVEAPDGHRYLRLTRPLEAGMVGHHRARPLLHPLSLLKKLEQGPTPW